MILNPFDDGVERPKAKIAFTFALLIVFNIAAWIWAWAAFADRPSLLGIALLAYMFGLRHAFDADHIAAIDNVVRKLMQEKKQPYAVGFFFSLGHSSIVVIASILIAATAAAMQNRLDSFHDIGGVIGTTVSAAFLLLIGIANLFVLKGVWSAFRRAQKGERIADEDLDTLLAGGGILARIFRP
ncbi:HoxN/HupN/NixA family nickel/cobalt transporter, partial [Rhizobium sp. A37_96]